MITTATLNRQELLQVAEAVAREKMIDRSVILQALAEAIQKTAKMRYGLEYDIRVNIHPTTGEITVQRYTEVVETPENRFTHISKQDADHKTGKSHAVGDMMIELLPPVDFGRVSAQNAKQIILQKVRDAERDKQYAEFKDRIGDIVMCVVKRAEFGTITVDIGGRGEGILRRNDVLPREMLKVGDRTRAYVVDVRREAKGPQVFLSRTHAQFMAKLFAAEVPEIYDGTIEIKNVARDPGSRAKIIVASRDASVDPVGSCVGMRGSRVQAITNELQGEKVDIIPWSADDATLVIQALAPARVNKVILDEDERKMQVIVDEDQLSPAIGRRGQNVRLASQVTGWRIDIMTDTEHSEKRSQEFTKRTALFMDALDVDEMIAGCLAAEDFATLDDVAFVEPQELLQIEGFDENLVNVLQDRARAYVAVKQSAQATALAKLALTDDELLALQGTDVQTIEDFAGLTADDLIDTTGYFVALGTERTRAEQLIMTARKLCGWLNA